MTEIAAKGTLIALFNVSFITIAQVRSITGPGMSVDMIDSSHHSTVDFWRTMLAGFKSGGEVTLDLLFDPADITHKDITGGLLKELNDGNLGSYEITYPDVASSTFTFSAFVSGYEVPYPLLAVADLMRVQTRDLHPCCATLPFLYRVSTVSITAYPMDGMPACQEVGAACTLRSPIATTQTL